MNTLIETLQGNNFLLYFFIAAMTLVLCAGGAAMIAFAMYYEQESERKRVERRTFKTVGGSAFEVQRNDRKDA
jgi:hypothetical protein